MSRIEILMTAGLLAVTAPLAAQEADTTAAPAAENAAAAATEAPVAEEPERHDWEFTLAATDKAPGASANVMVTDNETGSVFVLMANGLPMVDSLDEEGRDVNAYTVWVVPGKDKVSESELVGVLTVTPEGAGRLQGETPLETFGLIVTATPDGAPERIGGVPVLTGIPVRPEAPVDAEPAEVAEEAADVAEDVAEEVEDVADEAADVAEEAEEAVEEARPEADASP
ncbi:MAG TPA: hypothetical protein VMR66_01910 [Gemmatimonadota bacterium]|nr:hypothetical protein [Gemmatimonadota bacterium]